jgi:hypothetical protein
MGSRRQTAHLCAQQGTSANAGTASSSAWRPRDCEFINRGFPKECQVYKPEACIVTRAF